MTSAPRTNSSRSHRYLSARRMIDIAFRDLRLTVRGLVRTPGFTAVVLVTLALGIGASTAIFTVLEAVLLRPLPYHHADRVRVLWNGSEQFAISAPEYFDYKERLTTFDDVAAIRPQVVTIVGTEGEPERLSGYLVTPNLFELLGTSPAIGRGFRPGDGIPEGERTVILSHGLWRRRFAGDSGILGREVNLAGLPRVVIGIMPPAIRFPDAPIGFARERADLWIPATLENLRASGRGNQNLAVLARLARGLRDGQAAADLAALEAGFRREYPDRYGRASDGWRIVSIPLRTQMVGPVRPALVVLGASVGLLLMIACANVANLLLARGTLRRREVAVRMALGASRGVVIRQLLTESLVLSLAGGLLGVAVAAAGTPLLLRLDGGAIPRLDGARASIEVILFSFAVALITGLLVGIVPALRQSRTDFRADMAESSRAAGDGIRRRRSRAALVAGQIAMAVVILIAAGLLGRSLRELGAVDPGFTAAGTLSLELTLPRSSYENGVRVVDFYRRLVDGLGELPGAASASVVYPLPMSGEAWSGSFAVDGAPPEPVPHAEFAVAGPDYFRTLRIGIVEGREFDRTDGADAPPVAIVDERLARRHWPGSSVIGKRLSVDGRNWLTVVGVVRHVHSRARHDEGEPQLYFPLAQHPQRQMFVVVRAAAGPALALAGGVRQRLADLDPTLPGTRLNAVTDLSDRTLAPQRFNATVIIVFAAVALGLASIGLYGVMAYLVAQRTREIGIRVALGGRPGDVRAMIVRESLLIAVAGLGLGIAGSVAVSPLLGRLLFGVPATDPATYGLVTGLLLMVAVAAAAGPARRATRVDPVVALRD